MRCGNCNRQATQGTGNTHRCERCADELHNADHPARQAAIAIIENVIEPLLGRGLRNEKYYQAEDSITFIIAGE